jgi:hypothetical protein
MDLFTWYRFGPGSTVIPEGVFPETEAQSGF